MKLPYSLKKAAEDINVIARGYGLDFFDTVFEMVDYKTMNELAAYEGFSTRYPHWRFGMEYENLRKSYQYGLHKIYEMVINNDPTYAYLLEGNSQVDQKLVIAHVYAHSDFFKNNASFAHTSRKMMDEMANHAARIRKHVELHGREEVETFLDTCLSLNNLVDYLFPYQEEEQARREAQAARATPAAGAAKESVERRVVRFKAKDYMDRYVNPEGFIEDQRVRIRQQDEAEKQRFPRRPVKDVMWFLLENAPLEPWQQELMEIVREEAYYFAPQGQTKIMNEGWAAFWHSRIMTRKVLEDGEIIDFADHHSGAVQANPHGVNPYKLGIDLFRDIEERWNRGRFGKEYEECDNAKVRAGWDRRLGLGTEKIFEVRRTHNDVTFLDEFLTPEFVWEQKYYLFGLNPRENTWEITSREFSRIKEQLLSQLTNFGQPYIEVVDANHRNRGELLLEHRWEGQQLRRDYAEHVLTHLQQLWTRPVAIRTMKDDKPVFWSWDGQSFTESE
jgi:stage V sporulation protein R